MRDLLAGQGWKTGDCRIAMFSRTGFGADLVREAANGRAVLVDLKRLYGG